MIGLLVGLAVWPLNAAAAIGLVLLMIGAVITQLRVGDEIKHFAPALMFGVLSAAELIFRIAGS